MSEKISAILYNEKMNYLGASGPPFVRNIWIPSYNLIIMPSGHIRHRDGTPFRFVQEQKDDIQKHGLGQYYIDNIVDPKIEEIQVDKNFADKALEIFMRQNQQKEAENQLKNVQTEFITEFSQYF